MLRNFLLSILGLILVSSCGSDYLPKPKAMLRLEYPDARMQPYETLYFSFERNQVSEVGSPVPNGITLEYPEMEGTIYLTYKPVEGNIDKLLSDAQKFAYEHVVKADAILEQPFVNPDEQVYGMFYEVKGDAASQAQFYVTDSSRHFVTGSLYFYARPNYDSIYPAARYLQKDIRRIMETLRWK